MVILLQLLVLFLTFHGIESYRRGVYNSRSSLRMASEFKDVIYQLPLQVGQEVIIKIDDILNNGMGLGRVKTS